MFSKAAALKVYDDRQPIRACIDRIIATEGGYVDDPNDPGGATKYGITETTARAHGYTGPMRHMDQGWAKAIYVDSYVIKPKYHHVIMLDPRIGYELVDSGVNCGRNNTGRWLQRALNTFSDDGKRYGKVVVDGYVGPATIKALQRYLSNRPDSGSDVMVKAQDCQQGAYYMGLNQTRYSGFEYGWFRLRIGNVT